jgi:hypothetical protein
VCKTTRSPRRLALAGRAEPVKSLITYSAKGFTAPSGTAIEVRGGMRHLALHQVSSVQSLITYPAEGFTAPSGTKTDAECTTRTLISGSISLPVRR